MNNGPKIKKRHRSPTIPAIPRWWTIYTDAHSFRLCLVPGLRDKTGRLSGDIDFDAGRIRLDSRKPKSEQWAALWEELIHSWADARQIRLSEQTVSSLAEFLAAVCKHNDWWPAKTRAKRDRGGA